MALPELNILSLEGDYSITEDHENNQIIISDRDFKLQGALSKGTLHIATQDRTFQDNTPVIHHMFSDPTVVTMLYQYFEVNNSIDSISIDFSRGSDLVPGPYYEMYEGGVQEHFYAQASNFQPDKVYDAALLKKDVWGKQQAEELGFTSVHLASLSVQNAQVLFHR